MIASRVIEIRPLHIADELRQCQEVQRHAWGITDDGYVVPVATLAAAAAYGGLVLGALDNGRVVGFAFAFRGVVDGTPCLYSQLTGVLPETQGSGIGRRIKAAQRTWAREQGLPSIVWAFDPMQAMNAHYNLVALGATATHYHPDFYGPRADALNHGLPTDRLIAVWPTTDLPPSRPMPVTETAVALLTSHEAAGGGRVPAPQPWQAADVLSIEIPADLAALHDRSEHIAAWQEAIRQAFTQAFAEGYTAVTFARGDRPRYFLVREGERFNHKDTETQRR